MHAEFDHDKEKDVGGGVLTTDEKAAPVYDTTSSSSPPDFDDGFEYPTEEEKATLRHVPYCKMPSINECDRACLLTYHDSSAGSHFPRLHHRVE